MLNRASQAVFYLVPVIPREGNSMAGTTFLTLTISKRIIIFIICGQTSFDSAYHKIPYHSNQGSSGQSLSSRLHHHPQQGKDEMDSSWSWANAAFPSTAISIKLRPFRLVPTPIYPINDPSLLCIPNHTFIFMHLCVSIIYLALMSLTTKEIACITLKAPVRLNNALLQAIKHWLIGFFFYIFKILLWCWV